MVKRVICSHNACLIQLIRLFGFVEIKELDMMLQLAGTMSAGISPVRANYGWTHFGEMTMYEGAGFDKYCLEKFCGVLATDKAPYFTERCELIEK